MFLHTAQSTESLLSNILATSDCDNIHDLPCTVARAAFAGFNSTCQLFATAYLDYDILPSLVEDLLDFLGDVDNLSNRNDLVETMNVAVEQFIVPEGIWLFPVQVQITNFITVYDGAFAS